MIQHRISGSFVAGALLLSATFAQAEALKVDVYNPGAKSLFPVSSELVTGKSEAVLIDAQFQRNDAEALVAKVKASGKKLTTVFISHPDPDFYFGLDVIKAAFPDVKVLATAATIEAIKASKDGKMAYWGPILKDNAPKTVIVPEPIQGDTLKVDGQKLQVMGLKGPTPDRTYIWAPSIKTAMGGVLTYGNMHVWTADTQTPKDRADWQKSLKNLQALKPKVVVPGHFLNNAPHTLASVKFTSDYLKTLEAELPKAKNSAELVTAMKQRYPKLDGVSDLELSAKVLKGEMKWPQ
ncbi:MULTISPECIES: MBL fold metallo-hydrolase [Chromobacterium]|uniref:MBL fold metallo-hydrolase n=1 Tax=Chromobacterium aquaticum TaxID=467180 RepID=A0ABV8ZP35_9NEIS|nr:MBL fold metallo-hydrolase [Chromobacterium aquaticum]MCD5360270.1 MBL fold metallo-hydrolase [Chromobacterium aquaticum]